MAKNSLINGSIWEQYSQKVQDRMNNPRYMGEITEEEASSWSRTSAPRVAAMRCGCIG